MNINIKNYVFEKGEKITRFFYDIYLNMDEKTENMKIEGVGSYDSVNNEIILSYDYNQFLKEISKKVIILKLSFILKLIKY